ncbi:unnamed protein product [Hydatigera taeniaeformis]|uniref:BTB/POZ domain-containing protein n=1 Tax=Hydatigena taeniaeformis TaxID=6205 RepID=A0A0R3X0P8_HYDTA|nr:unnamed protein product [Hydatigera taeniaeformis]
MDMFKDIGFNFDNEVLRAVRFMYSDRRSSSSQNNLRVTKKVNLSSTHSVVRVATRLSNRLLSLYERNLIKRILISMHENVNEVTCRRLLLRLVKAPSVPCTPNCSCCQRITTEGFISPSFSNQKYNGDEDIGYPPMGARWVGSTVSDSRHFALPPENGPCPMEVSDKSLSQSLSLDTSPFSDPCPTPPTSLVEPSVNGHHDRLAADDLISSSSSCNSL